MQSPLDDFVLFLQRIGVSCSNDLFAESAEAATEATLFLLDTYFDDMTPAQSLQVLKATGLSDILGHPGDSESPATPHSLRRSRKGGAGRLADTALRIAIERHAVHLAVQHYRGMDYIVTEVGKPYDLRAVKEDEELHVEVKGSTRSVHSRGSVIGVMQMAGSGGSQGFPSRAAADGVECGDAVGGGGVEVAADAAPAGERGEGVPVPGDGLVALGGLGAALGDVVRAGRQLRMVRVIRRLRAGCG